MITSSMRARIIGSVPEALAWAKEVSAIAAKASGGANANVAFAVSGHQDCIWTMQFENLAAYEKGQAALQSSDAFQASVKKMREAKLFDNASVERGIWRSL